MHTARIQLARAPLIRGGTKDYSPPSARPGSRVLYYVVVDRSSAARAKRGELMLS